MSTSSKPPSNRLEESSDLSFIDPTNDATFQSLRRLLSAPASSTQHLSLLSEPTLYGSISYYFSRLEQDHVADFVQVLCSSACLWIPPPPSHAPHPTQTLSSFLISRSSSISQAVAASVAKRIALIIQSCKGSTGWATRRQVTMWISTIVSGLSASESLGQPESYQASRGLPIPRFAILSGLLQGFYSMREQKKSKTNRNLLQQLAEVRSNPSLGLSVKKQIGYIEDEWIVTLAEILETLEGETTSEAKQTDPVQDDLDEWEKEFGKKTAEFASFSSITSIPSTGILLGSVQEIRDVPLYLAAHLASYIPDKKLEALDAKQLASTTADAILSIFEGPSDSCFLIHLPNEVTADLQGQIILPSDGPTVALVSQTVETSLFSLLGPLSKLLSKALARATTSMDPNSLAEYLLETSEQANVASQSNRSTRPILIRMSRLAEELETRWLSTCLAGATEDQIAEASKKHTTQLWTIFKTILFSYTMVFDSMMDALLEMCPSPTLTLPPLTTDDGNLPSKWQPASRSNLPPPYVVLIQSILQTFSHLYWITSTFGSDGFDVYRKVFYEALDIIGRDAQGCIELLEMIRPDNTSQNIESNQAKRSATTYFLNVAEQLVNVLPDEVVESMLLPICRPYLQDTRFKETFESAHSVVIAVFLEKKRCTLELAPFYIDLLTNNFPKLFNSTQLEYGFTAILTALSDQDDAIAWWAICQLAEEIERERFRQPVVETALEDGQISSPSEEVVAAKAEKWTPLPPSSSSSSTTQLQRDTAEQTTVQPISPSRLVSLQLCLIAGVSCVNLVLLQSVLSKVETFILEQMEHDEKLKRELCEKAFDAIQALNASTREEGIRWWLQRRAKFGV